MHPQPKTVKLSTEGGNVANAVKMPSAARTNGRPPAAGSTLHQLRLAAEQPRLVAWLKSTNSGLSYQDCEDIVAEYVALEACAIPAQLSWPIARKLAYLRLQHRAVDALRHRDGRRDSEKTRRQVVSLSTTAGVDDDQTIESVIADPGPEVIDELTSAQAEATQLLGRALVQLKPAWAEALILTLERPDAAIAELAAEAGVGANVFNHRLRCGRRAMRQAVSRVVLGPECETARAALRRRRLRRPVDPAAIAFAHMHADDCLACWAWQRPAEAVAALLPLLPAATLAERLTPLSGPGGEVVAAGTAAAATGTTAVGGLAGSVKAVVAICGATAATAGVCTAVIETVHDPAPVPPVQVQVDPTPAPTAEPTATPAGASTPAATPTTVATPAATATPDHEKEIPAPAAPGASEFEPSAPTAPVEPAPAQGGGGGEFQP